MKNSMNTRNSRHGPDAQAASCLVVNGPRSLARIDPYFAAGSIDTATASLSVACAKSPTLIIVSWFMSGTRRSVAGQAWALPRWTGRVAGDLSPGN